MFYTEYRPQKFNELIGAEHIVAALTGSLAKNAPAHAYFFTGSRGTGKTTTARLLAKALNCSNPKLMLETAIKYEPCDECASCLAVRNGNHLDLIEIDAASNRGIDNIRELRDGVGLSPSMGKRKIYIIDEVHMLTTEASNALLKTLEEPPEHAYFILCTTNPEKVLDTIKSRCLQFQFKRPNSETLVSKLRRIVEDKKYEVDDSALKQIAILAKGAFRDAETFLEQFIAGEKEINNVISLDTKHGEFFKLILESNRLEPINFIHQVYESGTNIESWTEKLVSYLRFLLLSKLGVKTQESEFIIDETEKFIIQNCSESKFKQSIEIFSKALSEFKFAVVPTLPLELAVIELTSTETTVPTVHNTHKVESLPIEIKTETKPAPKLDIKLKKPDPYKRNQKLEAEGRANDEPKAKSNKSIPFSYKGLIEAVKPKNHAIHLILHSCEFVNFDGKYLDLRANYSFHKERLLSTKIREIIQDVASELAGGSVVLRCELSSKNPDAKKLTDKNVVSTTEKANLEDVFEKVFGDDIAAATE